MICSRKSPLKYGFIPYMREVKVKKDWIQVYLSESGTWLQREICFRLGEARYPCKRTGVYGLFLALYHICEHIKVNIPIKILG